MQRTMPVFVDSKAPSGGDGTDRNPYKYLKDINYGQIQKWVAANAQVSINLACGSVWREELRPLVGGRSGNRIKIQPWGWGDLPLLKGSISQSEEADWQQLGDTLWATREGSFPKSTEFSNSDTGFAMFGPEAPENAGVKVFHPMALTRDRRYIYDRDKERVLVFARGNPASLYDGIEIADSRYRSNILIQDVEHIDIVGIATKYSSVNGISIENGALDLGARHIGVEYCNLAYGGGFKGSKMRIGAGVHLGRDGKTSDITIKHCAISQFWDAAIGGESYGRQGNELVDLVIEDNDLSRCHAGVNITAGSDGYDQLIEHVSVRRNKINQMGYGWSGYDNDGAFHGKGVSVNCRFPERGTVVRHVAIEHNEINTFAARGVNLHGGECYSVAHNLITGGTGDWDKQFTGALVIHGGGWNESIMDVYGLIEQNHIIDNAMLGGRIVNNRPVRGKLILDRNELSGNELTSAGEPFEIRASDNYELIAA